MKSSIIKGRTWVIKDASGRFIDNIDTDQIYHNKHLAVTDIEQMGKFAFGNLNGWEDFPSRVRTGDILIVGRNFGSGSSRQQAVDCFRALGISAIVGISFGAIYYRNAVNSGFPVLVVPELTEETIETGEIIEINLITGRMRNITKQLALPDATGFSDVQRRIWEAGGLLNLKTL